MKTSYGGTALELYTFLTSALDQPLLSCLGRLQSGIHCKGGGGLAGHHNRK
jgi:hypothetical protein